MGIKSLFLTALILVSSATQWSSVEAASGYSVNFPAASGQLDGYVNFSMMTIADKKAVRGDGIVYGLKAGESYTYGIYNGKTPTKRTVDEHRRLTRRANGPECPIGTLFDPENRAALTGYKCDPLTYYKTCVSGDLSAKFRPWVGPSTTSKYYIEIEDVSLALSGSTSIVDKYFVIKNSKGQIVACDQIHAV
ncbi:hypothetical protein H4R33_003465 [Dimargaris cristalligena]|uniref:Uncharacterized protein n=1 Tax=Dimargaris cristalligena TaxID=215637 RepID=A0A4P9ZT60_9FUNG|nr:hypothetical protein H4R33_003465 [Dimargaris cristalligena]RKP36635.1 hypothetical protein BJ085DRAFT_29931 [Dimargaris cristalligena]|eukprot:RKP36635.1 hypothetical protein BJ085DRAFT_29931 [Dimargaris cristalligena]